MKIALDISPLDSGHGVRGVGFYIRHLKDALVTYFPEHSYTFFSKRSDIPADCDVVHFPYFDPFFRTLPLRKTFKTVVTVHDLTPLLFPEHFPAGIKGKVNWLIQKERLKHTDAILTDSYASQKDIHRLIGISKNAIHVAYLAAGEEFRKVSTGVASIRKKYHLPQQFALYVGDVTWNKNLPRLIEAIERTEIPLVMVGKSLSERNFDFSHPWNKDRAVIQLILQEKKQFILPGFISSDDLVALYNCATVSIVPSIYEGFGLPILEAMSCGCPVITTQEGSIPEVAGDAAYYVDAFDISDIQKGIQKVFSDTKLQQELSQKGFQQAKKFSWKKTAEQTLAVYSHI